MSIINRIIKMLKKVLKDLLFILIILPNSHIVPMKWELLLIKKSVKHPHGVLVF